MVVEVLPLQTGVLNPLNAQGQGLLLDIILKGLDSCRHLVVAVIKDADVVGDLVIIALAQLLDLGHEFPGQPLVFEFLGQSGVQDDKEVVLHLYGEAFGNNGSPPYPW